MGSGYLYLAGQKPGYRLCAVHSNLRQDEQTAFQIRLGPRPLHETSLLSAWGIGWPQHIQLAAQLRLQEQYQWGYHISTAKRQDDTDYSSTEVSIEMMFADAVKALGGDTYSWSLYNVVVLTTISASRNTEGPAYISGVRPNISQVKSKRLHNQRW